jgi:transcriptional regulator with XRE-family HTH domain
MTTLQDVDRWVPADTFGARLALIRQHLGLNIRQAADRCGVGEKSWRDWEDGVSPKRYEATCSKIAVATGCNVRWLKAGGPLVQPGEGPGGQGEPSTSWETPSESPQPITERKLRAVA